MVARVYGVVAVVLALAGTGCHGISVLADAEHAEGTFERRLSVEGPVTLDVTTGSGSIVIRTGAGHEVVVTGRVLASSGGLFDRGLSGTAAMNPEERVRRIVADPPVRQDGQAIGVGRIDDDRLRQRVAISYTVIVPVDTTVASRTGSGSQQIQGVTGSVAASAGSGSIEVRDVGDRVQASTGSGSIAVDRVGALDARAGSGSIEGRAVRGGIRARTGSGSIRLEQSEPGDVDASAGSGTIAIAGVRGRVTAATGSGSIGVTGVPESGWQLKTGSGNVTLEVAGQPGFDLAIHGGDIDMRLPMTTVQRVGRRELRGVVNGGGPPVNIQAGSGRIRIR